MVKIRSYLLIAIARLLVAGTCLTSCADVSAMSRSSLTGLATMRAMAQQSTPISVALANGKPSLVEFYADWCTTCQSLAPSLEKLHQQYGEEINFVMLNVDEPQWKEMIQEYQVTGVPQLTFLSRDRQLFQTLIGKVPETVIAQIFDQISS